MFDESVHNTIKRKNKIFAVCVTVCILVFTTVRMILTRFCIDSVAHFYKLPENPNLMTRILVSFFDYIVAGCVIAIYLISFFIYKRRKENHKYNETADCFVQGTQSQVFSASLTGFLFISISVFQLYYFINPGDTKGLTLQEAVKMQPVIEAVKTQPVIYLESLRLSDRFIEYIQKFPFDFLIFFVSILSAVYFFKTAILNFDIGETAAPSENKPETGPEDIEKERAAAASYKYSSAHIVFSFMPIVWAFLNIFKCFFDMSTAVNSPVRIYELISFLALSAYFVSEARMVVGRLETSRFFTFAYIALIVAAVSSLPNLIWSAFGRFGINNHQIIYAAQLSLVVYMLSRVYSQIRYGRFLLQR